MTTPRRSPSPPPTRPLRLPPGWRTLPLSEPGVLLLAHAPRVPASGVRPTLVLQVGAPPPVAARDLEDTDEFTDAEGREVYYRRWTPADAPDQVCEAWTWEELTLTLTARLARDDYLDHCDLLDEIAGTLDLRSLRLGA